MAAGMKDFLYLFVWTRVDYMSAHEWRVLEEMVKTADSDRMDNVYFNTSGLWSQSECSAQHTKLKKKESIFDLTSLQQLIGGIQKSLELREVHRERSLIAGSSYTAVEVSAALRIEAVFIWQQFIWSHSRGWYFEEQAGEGKGRIKTKTAPTLFGNWKEPKGKQRWMKWS